MSQENRTKVIEKIDLLNTVYHLIDKESFIQHESNFDGAVKCVPNFGKISFYYRESNIEDDYFCIEIRSHDNRYFQGWKLGKCVSNRHFLNIIEVAAQELVDAIRFGEHQLDRNKCNHDHYLSIPQQILIRSHSLCRCCL